jgi:hypothetical protein
MAADFGLLGVLAEERGQIREAMEHIIRCVTLFSEFPHPATEPGAEYLALLTGELGTAVLEECWQAITGSPVPPAVHDYLDSAAL